MNAHLRNGLLNNICSRCSSLPLVEQDKLGHNNKMSRRLLSLYNFGKSSCDEVLVIIFYISSPTFKAQSLFLELRNSFQSLSDYAEMNCGGGIDKIANVKTKLKQLF